MKVNIMYNKTDDTFGIFINNRPAITIELEDDILFRIDPKTKEFISLEIPFFRKFMRELYKTKNLVFTSMKEFIKDLKQV